MARKLVLLVGVVSILGAAYATLRWAVLASPEACISDELQTVPNLDGAKLEIIYTNCDTLIKDEAIRVYVSRASDPGESWPCKVAESKRSHIRL